VWGARRPNARHLLHDRAMRGAALRRSARWRSAAEAGTRRRASSPGDRARRNRTGAHRDGRTERDRHRLSQPRGGCRGLPLHDRDTAPRGLPIARGGRVGRGPRPATLPDQRPVPSRRTAPRGAIWPTGHEQWAKMTRNEPYPPVQENARRRRERLASAVSRHSSIPCRTASHARGRRFETRRAHAWFFPACVASLPAMRTFAQVGCAQPSRIA
jgi:hypothetical protein